MEQLKQTKPTERIPPPNNKILSFMYDVAAHVVFDVVINTLIIINMVPIVLELASDDDASYMTILNLINYVYCGIYISEALWKVCDVFLFLSVAVVAVMPDLYVLQQRSIG